MTNAEIFEFVSNAVEELKKKKSPATKDGLVLIAIYKNKETKRKSDAKVFIDGYTPEEVDVLIRQIYGQVYEIRKRKDPKSQELEKYLNSKKNNL